MAEGLAGGQNRVSLLESDLVDFGRRGHIGLLRMEGAGGPTNQQRETGKKLLGNYWKPLWLPIIAIGFFQT